MHLFCSVGACGLRRHRSVYKPTTIGVGAASELCPIIHLDNFKPGDKEIKLSIYSERPDFAARNGNGYE